MPTAQEIIDFLHGSDVKLSRQKPATFESQATPRSLRRYNQKPEIVQSESGRRGGHVDQSILDFQQTDAYQRLPKPDQRREVGFRVALSVRSDLQTRHIQPSKAEEEFATKRRTAVQRTREAVGISGLQKLIARIKSL